MINRSATTVGGKKMGLKNGKQKIGPQSGENSDIALSSFQQAKFAAQNDISHVTQMGFHKG